MPEVVSAASGPQGRASNSWDILKQEPSPPELGEQPATEPPAQASEPPAEQLTETEHEPLQAQSSQPDGQEQQKEQGEQPKREKLSRYERTKRQRAALEQRERAIAEREQAIAQAETAKNKPSYTVAELKTYRKNWEKEGNYDLVERADAEIARLGKLEAESKQTLEIPKSGSDEFVKQWKDAEAELYQYDPEFQREGTRLDQMLRQMMSGPDGKLYRQHPRGIVAAYSAAKLQIAQGDLQAARDEIKALKQENNRLNGLTSISGSGAAGRGLSEMRGKDFASMSTKEMREHLKRNAVRGRW